MSDEPRITTTTLAETENYLAWKSDEPDGEAIYHVEAGAVTLAIHRAGAVMQRDQPVQREIEEVARRPPILAGHGDERAGVVLLDHRCLLYERESLPSREALS